MRRRKHHHHVYVVELSKDVLSEPTCAPVAVCTATTSALIGSNCKGPATGPGGTWVKVGVNGGVMDGLWWCCSSLDEIAL